jgi:8-oxo-dGTP diphosphatase
MKLELHPIKPNHNKHLTYVIVVSRYHAQWIFVRHKERTTWEIPAGHIEAGEHPDQAARRELWEETGATGFNIKALFDYSVTRNDESKSGRVYYAEVFQLEKLPEMEIAEIMIADQLPASLTYPEIQTEIFLRVMNKRDVS